MKHKGAMGNGQGRAVEVALNKTAEVVETIEEVKGVMERMNDKQRKLFVALSRGKDELFSALEAGYTEWFTGIAKVLDLKEEFHTEKIRTMETAKLTARNLHMISDNSYERLLSICRNRVEKQTAGVSYKDHISSIQDFFQLIAPDAYGVIGDIMLDPGVKDETRLKAAQDVLDRAGYKERAGATSDNPLMVNIILPGGPKIVEAEVIDGD